MHTTSDAQDVTRYRGNKVSARTRDKCAQEGPGIGHVSASASTVCRKLPVQPEAAKALQVCIASRPQVWLNACLKLADFGLNGWLTLWGCDMRTLSRIVLNHAVM